MDKNFPQKLQYFTMAARLSGYADALDPDDHRSLMHMLQSASRLLEQVWDEYNKERPDGRDIA